MTILDTIVADCQQRMAARQRLTPLDTLRRTAGMAPPPRGFLAALQKTAATGEPALICEMKKASPSKGALLDDYNPAALAEAYAAGGATCLSVLTEEDHFHGALEHLLQARDACMLPVLRKDFITHEYQISEARAWGADCILLIMACLEQEQAKHLCHRAMDMGMDVLVEVHTAEELTAALVLPTRLLGINNRDLKTLKTDLDVTRTLAKQVPDDYFLVSESGIATAAEVRDLMAVAAKGFLVGHSLLGQPDLIAATRALRTAA